MPTAPNRSSETERLKKLAPLPSAPAEGSSSVERSLTVCPSCGRYVGTYARCQYCGARTTRRLAISLFRYGSVALALIGLPLLYIVARLTQPNLVTVGGITPSMNFALVTVNGTAGGDARLFSEGGRPASLSFALDDGTGTIEVRGFKQVAREIVAQDHLPRHGDQVHCTGSIRVRGEGDVSLLLQDASQLTVERVVAQQVSLAQARTSENGVTVRIRARVEALRPPRADSKEPWRFELADDSGAMTLVLWQSQIGASPPAWVVGTQLEGPAEVGDYRGVRQLTVRAAADLAAQDGSAPAVSATEGTAASGSTPAPSPVPTPAPTAAVRGADEPAARFAPAGHEAVLKAAVARVASELPGAHDAAPSAAAARVSASAAGRERVSIAALTAADEGRVVSLTGTVGAARRISKGTVYDVREVGADIKMVLWDDISGAVGGLVGGGACVQVTGRIKVYGGALEIVPRSASDILACAR